MKTFLFALIVIGGACFLMGVGILFSNKVLRKGCSKDPDECQCESEKKNCENEQKKS